eukprot:12033041-Alexandrium_andersonii.AAC.1
MRLRSKPHQRAEHTFARPGMRRQSGRPRRRKVHVQGLESRKSGTLSVASLGAGRLRVPTAS